MKTDIIVLISSFLTGSLCLWLNKRRRVKSGQSFHGITSPQHWRYKYIYYDRQDRRIFVPREAGKGFTINYGNPYSIIVSILMVVFIVFLRDLLFPVWR